MSLRDSVLTIGLEQSLAFNGDLIIYCRGTDKLAFSAIRGQHIDQAVDGNQIFAEVERVDYLFPIAELASLSPAEPGKEDWIEFDGETWQVTEQPGVGYWRFVDPAHTWVRVRVTRTG